MVEREQRGTLPLNDNTFLTRDAERPHSLLVIFTTGHRGYSGTRYRDSSLTRTRTLNSLVAYSLKEQYPVFSQCLQCDYHHRPWINWTWPQIPWYLRQNIPVTFMSLQHRAVTMLFLAVHISGLVWFLITSWKHNARRAPRGTDGTRYA